MYICIIMYVSYHLIYFYYHQYHYHPYHSTYIISQSYYIGRLHCFVDGWADSSIKFLKSGGFVVSPKVPLVTQNTLIVWGRNDEILPPEFPTKFKEGIQQSELIYLEECGHVPHLEKPEETAAIIEEFLSRVK